MHASHARIHPLLPIRLSYRPGPGPIYRYRVAIAIPIVIVIAFVIVITSTRGLSIPACAAPLSLLLTDLLTYHKPGQNLAEIKQYSECGSIDWGGWRAVKV